MKLSELDKKIKEENKDLKSIKVRLYPSDSQFIDINNLCHLSRAAYNVTLRYSQDNYLNASNKLKDINLSKEEIKEITKEKYTSTTQAYTYFNEWKKGQDWTNDIIGQSSIQRSIINCLDAYKGIDKSKKNKNGRIYGMPKFKKRYKCKHSFYITNQAILFKPIRNNNLFIAYGIGEIKFKCSNKDREYLATYGKYLNSITVEIDKVGKVFASINLPRFNKTQFNKTGKEVGIDLGIKTLMTLSDGNKMENKRFRGKYDKRIKQAHKELSRKVKGSNNRSKARTKLATIYSKMTNEKYNYLHNITTQLIRDYDIIYLEDLSVKDMLKNSDYAKYLDDVCLGEIRRMLEYKSKWYGKELIFINQYYPSTKLCSSCGNKQDMDISERIYTCKCGLKLDRDFNASLNILKEGKELKTK